MSGWHSGDKLLAEDADDDFPQLNNITVPGIMPHDQNAVIRGVNEG